MIRVHACVVGLKGAIFLTGLVRQHVHIDRVYSYPQEHDRSQGYEVLEKLCVQHGIAMTLLRKPTRANFADADLIFLVGWQYLLPFQDSRVVVFHDSLLPRYRGFAPTVAALLAGEDSVGVTAFNPDSGVDSGPIFAQASMLVRRPARIGEVLTGQAQLMVDLAIELIARMHSGPLVGQAQDEAHASYALWRDKEDYFIDWSWSATAIERFVYAVGYPYEGAHTLLKDTLIVIDECRVIEDLNFHHRDPGKVWSNGPNGPVVVCGTGLIELTALRTADGSPFRLDGLRRRFETPSLPERRRRLGSGVDHR
jgi:methionyl-tRNA formyltransferase